MIVKDVVFNEEIIKEIHKKITKSEEMLKKVTIQSIVEKSSDFNYLKFLSKFLVNFASQIMPQKSLQKHKSRCEVC